MTDPNNHNDESEYETVEVEREITESFPVTDYRIDYTNGESEIVKCTQLEERDSGYAFLTITDVELSGRKVAPDPVEGVGSRELRPQTRVGKYAPYESVQSVNLIGKREDEYTVTTTDSERRAVIGGVVRVDSIDEACACRGRQPEWDYHHPNACSETSQDFSNTDINPSDAWDVSRCVWSDLVDGVPDDE